MRCIIHEVRRNSHSIATNFEENTAYFSQLEIIRLIQSIPSLLYSVIIAGWLFLALWTVES